MKTKKTNDKKENKPYLSAPVISRSGKIGRIDPEKTVDPYLNEEKLREKGSNAQNDRLPAERSRRDVTISDGAFISVNAGKAKKNRGIHTVKSREKNPFPVVTVLACLICTVLFMSLVFNLVRINEFTKDVSGMQKEVAALEKQKSELDAKLDEKNGVEELKAFLKEHADEMGMVEEGKMNPPVAVTPEKTEKIEDFDQTEESEAIFTTVLNALAKNFEDVFKLFTGDGE